MALITLGSRMTIDARMGKAFAWVSRADSDLTLGPLFLSCLVFLFRFVSSRGLDWIGRVSLGAGWLAAG